MASFLPLPLGTPPLPSPNLLFSPLCCTPRGSMRVTHEILLFISFLIFHPRRSFPSPGFPRNFLPHTIFSPMLVCSESLNLERQIIFPRLSLAFLCFFTGVCCFIRWPDEFASPLSNFVDGDFFFGASPFIVQLVNLLAAVFGGAANLLTGLLSSPPSILCGSSFNSSSYQTASNSPPPAGVWTTFTPLAPPCF